MSWVDVEEDARNYDGFLFEQFLEESLLPVPKRWLLDVKRIRSFPLTKPLLRGQGNFSRLSQM